MADRLTFSQLTKKSLHNEQVLDELLRTIKTHVQRQSYKVWDGTATAGVDDMTNTLQSISYTHHEVHAGDSYIADLDDTTMAAADYIGISFTTPTAAIGRVHIFARFASGAAAHLDLIEAPGTLTNGSAFVAYNRRRDSAKATNVTNLLSYDSTAGDVIAVGGGTVIHELYTFAAKQSGAGSAGDTEEIILNPSTSYAYRLTADGGSNAGHLILNWYEHIDSN